MTRPLRILVTGGTGFVGRHLVPRLIGPGRSVVLLTRTDQPAARGVDAVDPVGDLAGTAVPARPFEDADILVHLAGHVRGPAAAVDASLNVRMARNVAARARAAGISRVLVLSSIAASVVQRTPARARRYGYEKLAAEEVFRAEISADQRVVFIRPPAVYGAGMAGPLAALCGLIRRGVPLPFAGALAPRDYISANNLCSLLAAIAAAPGAAWDTAGGAAFAPSDGAAVATADLARMMAQVLGRPARLFPVPHSMLRAAGRVTGRAEMISGAIDGLELADNTPLTRIFGWSPQERMPQSLAFLSDG